MCISSLDLLTQIQNKIGNIFEKVSHFLPLWTLYLELFILSWLYHRCTVVLSLAECIFFLFFFNFFRGVEEACKKNSRYHLAFICKIKYISLMLPSLLFCFPLRPEVSRLEIGQEWCHMNSWTCVWKAGSLFCGDGTNEKRFFSKNRLFWFLLYNYKKTKKTLFHKNLLGINYCKVNCIVIHSILWELLHVAKHREFYHKMKKEYSTKNPFHLKVRMIFNSWIAFIIAFSVSLRAPMKKILKV